MKEKEEVKVPRLGGIIASLRLRRLRKEKEERNDEHEQAGHT